jgi:iron complex transport system substrate-binding protein
LNQHSIKQRNKKTIRKTRKVCWGSFFIFPPPKGKIEAKEDRDDEKRNRESVCEKNLGDDMKKMKKKTKLLALLEIAIVLCSVFLVALPGIAAEQTSQELRAAEVTKASEDDYVLGIYGNANEDDTIDMRDLTYVKLIFFGKKPETELADAKYDGKINPLDFIQIKLIIVGKEKEITIIDSAERILTVKKPIERIVVFTPGSLETIRSLKATDKIVGVSEFMTADELFFPEFSEYPNVGGKDSPPDTEAVLALEPDAVFLYEAGREDFQDKLEAADPRIAVIRLGFHSPGDIFVEETKKLGYMLGRMEEAEEFIDFYGGWLGTIEERVEKLSDEDNPRVYFELFRPYLAPTKMSNFGKKLVMAGGYNIFGEELGGAWGSVAVDPEAVIDRDPEIIVRVAHWDIGGYALDSEDTTVLSDIRDEIMNRPELAHVSAVKNEEVYIITDHTIGGPARHFIGIGYLAKWFHPELFEDLDPKAIHQEYITRSQGLDYDLDKQGVFVYPEPS